MGPCYGLEQTTAVYSTAFFSNLFLIAGPGTRAFDDCPRGLSASHPALMPYFGS